MPARLLAFPPLRGHVPLVVAMLVDTLGSGLFLPFSILFFTVTTPLPVARIGLALAVATGISLPFGPVFGAAVDRWGARDVVVIGNLLRTVAAAAYLTVQSFPALIAAAALYQLGDRAFYSSYTPLISQVAGPGQRERWFGFIYAARNTGLAAGGALAGVAVAGGETGYRVLAMVNAMSFAVAAVLLLRQPVTPLPVREDAVRSGSWRTVLADRPYLSLVGVNVAFALPSSALTLVLPVYLVRQLELPAWTAGAAFTLNCVLVAVAQAPVVGLVEGRDRTRVLQVAGLLSAGSAVVFLAANLLPSAAALAVVALGVLVFTLGELTEGPAMGALSTGAAPDALRGRYVSAFQLSWSFANTAGLALLTWLLTLGPVQAWGFLAGVAVLGSAGIRLVGRRLPATALR